MCHMTHEPSHLVSLFPSNYLVWEGIQDLLEYMVLLTKIEVLGDWSWRCRGKGRMDYDLSEKKREAEIIPTFHCCTVDLEKKLF